MSSNLNSNNSDFVINATGTDNDLVVQQAGVEVARIGSGGFKGALSVDNLFHVQDQKATGVTGGTAIAGTQTRDLNTVVTNNIASASLATNQITLPAGDYFIEASTAGYACDGHQISLYNISDTAVEILGKSAYARSAYTVMSDSDLTDTFTLGASKTLEIQHYTAVSGAERLGKHSGSGNIEIYTDVKIWKVG